MKAYVGIKTAVVVSLQWLGVLIGFIASLVIANMILPVSRHITDATPPTGFLSLPGAMLFNGAVNASILLWAARRSSVKGVIMWMQSFVLAFGAQTLQMQIETAYFLSAFPLLKGNFELYRLVLRGLLTSLLVTCLVTLLVGGFTRKRREAANFTVPADRAVKAGSWLAGVYFVLYALFGYLVAWQSADVRLFYGGPAELNSFADQWAVTLMARPELPVFQYFRGILWMLCLIPLFKGFSGKRVELVVLSACALACLPTAQLAFANALMPTGVSLVHFREVSISTGIFGALCAWSVPKDSVR